MENTRGMVDEMQSAELLTLYPHLRFVGIRNSL